MTTTQYQLCEGDTASALTKAVNKYLSSGQPWEIWGQPFFAVSNANPGGSFYQAIVCVEPDEEEDEDEGEEDNE